MNIKINKEKGTITVKDMLPDLNLKVDEMKKYFEEKYKKEFKTTIS